MDNAVKKFRAAIRWLNRYRQEGREKPHQLIMLLTVLDLVEKGDVTANRFVFDSGLRTRFSTLFAAIASLRDRDLSQPAPPFFHLRSSGFWHHVPLPGRDADYSSLTTSGGGSKRITDNIDHAEFDEWAWNVINDPQKRREITQFILDEFFSEEERYRLTLALRSKPQAPRDNDE